VEGIAQNMARYVQVRLDLEEIFSLLEQRSLSKEK
jgi:hypothetical protein